MILATFTIVIFIFSSKKIHYGLSELFFLLPFSSTMILATGTTSLFIFPKIALIIIFLFKKQGRLRYISLLSIILLFIYALSINTILGNLHLLRIINLALWFFIAYIIIDTTKDGIFMESIAFISGIILSGIIGFGKDYIPNLSSELINARYLNETTGSFVDRFAGLWNDPNGFTFFIICGLLFLQWSLINKKITLSTFSISSIILSIFGLVTLSKSCIILMILFWIYFILCQHSIGVNKKIGILTIFTIFFLIFYSKFSYLFIELIYRFGKGSSISKISLDVLTTSRSMIWSKYLSNIWLGTSFIFGRGIDAPLIGSFSYHNSYIQLIYEWGLIGSIFYIGTWINLLKQTNNIPYRRNWIPLLFVMSLFFFVSYLYIEYSYFLLPLVIRAGETKSYLYK